MIMKQYAYSRYIVLIVYMTIQCTIKSAIAESRQCENADDQTRCEDNKRYGICYKKRCFTLTTTYKPVLIKVRYSIDNKYLPSRYRSAGMWLRGNFPGYNWRKGVKMRQSEKDTWQILMNITLPVDGNRAKFEFRVYLNNQQDMLGANFQLSLPPSQNVYQTDRRGTPSLLTVYPWFFNKKGTISERRVPSPQLDEQRNITMYQPPSFYENTYKRYETMFFNDAQRVHLFLLQVELLMVEHAMIREILIVGLVNDYRERVALLAPTNGTNIECKQGTPSDKCGNCLKCTSLEQNCSFDQYIADYVCYNWVPIKKPLGQLYLDFIQYTLIPETQNAYRALPGASNVAMTGFSFSGLLTCHAVWTRPHVFGSGACMSSSFWWPFPGGNLTFPDDVKNGFVTETLQTHRGVRPRQKIYIDVGAEEGPIMIDPARNATRILASLPYFTLGENLWFHIWDKEDHNFTVSLQRKWVPLTAFYGAGAAPTADRVATAVSNHGNILRGHPLGLYMWYVVIASTVAMQRITVF